MAFHYCNRNLYLTNYWNGIDYSYLIPYQAYSCLHSIPIQFYSIEPNSTRVLLYGLVVLFLTCVFCVFIYSVPHDISKYITIKLYDVPSLFYVFVCFGKLFHYSAGLMKGVNCESAECLLFIVFFFFGL